jgi:serine/threonine protein kinase
VFRVESGTRNIILSYLFVSKMAGASSAASVPLDDMLPTINSAQLCRSDDGGRFHHVLHKLLPALNVSVDMFGVDLGEHHRRGAENCGKGFQGAYHFVALVHRHSNVKTSAGLLEATVELCPLLNALLLQTKQHSNDVRMVPQEMMDLNQVTGGCCTGGPPLHAGVSDVCDRPPRRQNTFFDVLRAEQLTRWVISTSRTALYETGSQRFGEGPQQQWCIRISLICSLKGGGCRQSTEAKEPLFSSTSQQLLLPSTPIQQNTPRNVHPTLSRPNAPIPPPLRGAGIANMHNNNNNNNNGLLTSSSKSTPIGTPSGAHARRGHHPSAPHNNVGSTVVMSHHGIMGASYTRHGDEDDALVTVHGVDEVLSEVDVHYVQDDGYIDLPHIVGGGGGGRTSGAATSERLSGSCNMRRGRKSVSELSRASSRGTSASFANAAVSGEASEFNEAAPNGHSDVVLRRLYIDHTPATGELGRGGFGVVYRAHDQFSGVEYAVKEAHYGKTGGDALMNNLRSEFRTLSQLLHPNIVRVYNFLIDEEERIARIVMELATNGSVRKLLSRSTTPNSPGGGIGRLTESVARRVVFQCILGLQHLHRNGIIHRDVKPDNILLGDDSVAKLSDFGTCKSTIHASTGTTTTVVGTVCYMSPESIAGSFSTGSDIWSVGVTTIELLSGLAPWSELRCMQSIHLVFQIGSARPPNHRPQFPAPQLGISRNAVQFLEACTTYDPKQRPTSTDLLSFPWFDGVYDELPLIVRRYLDANPVPPSRWRPTASLGSAPLAATVLAPSTRVASRGKAVERQTAGPVGQVHRGLPHSRSNDDQHHFAPPRVNTNDNAALGRVGVWHKDESDDDTFETWPEDRDEEDEELVVAGDDEYEYEYV